MLKKLLWGMFLAAFLGVWNAEQAYGLAGFFDKGLRIEELRIPVASGISLTGKVYQRRDISNAQPLVIFISPWSVGIWIYDAKARLLAEQGYTVLAYNPRGWAGSGGAVDSAGANDVADATAVIDWLLEQYRVDPERIGMGGISLGAGTALMAAAYDPRIRAVLAFSGWTDLFTSTFGNNTERSLWHRILSLSAQVLGGASDSGQGVEAYVKARDIEKIKEHTDPRSPAHVLDRYRDNGTAIFLNQNYSDFLFPVSDIWHFFERLESPKRIRLQPGIHASAEVLEVFFERHDELWLDAQAWLDYWVKHRGGNGAEQPDAIHLTIPGEKKDLSFAETADLSIEKTRYYLQKNPRRGFAKLSQEFPAVTGSHSIKSAVASGVNAGIPVIYPLIDSLQPTETKMRTRGIRLDRAAVYEWGPFRTRTRMLGIPRVQLKLASTQLEAQLVAYLFKLTPGDEWKVVSIAPFTAFDFVKGEPTTLAFDLFSGFASFEKGDRLVLAIDTYDLEFAPAVLQEFQLRIFADGDSYIDIPWALDGALGFGA